jgi:copper chaperone CopZ
VIPRGRPDIRRRLRRPGLATLLVSLVLLLPACASGTAGSGTHETETSAARTVAETTTARAAGATSGAGETIAQTGADSEQATASYHVPTITCPSCVARVEANAKKEPGVVDAKADLSTQEVTVTYDPTKTDPERIAEAIRQGGDTVVPNE